VEYFGVDWETVRDGVLTRIDGGDCGKLNFLLIVEGAVVVAGVVDDFVEEAVVVPPA
jgi:hypothetical protein